ncbi:MAG: SRPBCC family protein [Pseudomonadota bacterium]
MAEVSASATINGAVDKVWALLADFGRIEAWWPADGKVVIDHVVNEGEGVGMVRHIYNKGASAPVSERLELLDPLGKVLILSIIAPRPGAITGYVATSRLTALGPDSCRMEHRAHVTTEPGREQAVEIGLYKTYEVMFAGLNAALKRQAT